MSYEIDSKVIVNRIEKSLKKKRLSTILYTKYNISILEQNERSSIFWNKLSEERKLRNYR